MLGTVDKELTIYNFGIIICKIEKEPFIIYDEIQEKIIYHEKQMRFDIVEIGRYNVILGILQLYEHNPQIDWVISLISTTWHCENRSILIGRDSTIGNIYKEQDINESIQIIRILSLTDAFFLVDIVFEKY